MDVQQFKPTLGKVAFSLFIVVVIYQLSNSIHCGICPENMPHQSWPEIAGSCDCVIGSSFSEFLQEILQLIILPFFASYIIYSLIAHLRKSN